MKNIKKKTFRLASVTLTISTALLILTSIVFTAVLHQTNLKPGRTQALSGDISWRAFNGGVDDPGSNTSETTISTSNVSQLTKLWQTTLPADADNAVVEAANVTTGSGTMDLAFVNTVKGNLIAYNTTNGAKIWEVDHDATNFNGQGTKSTPAIDPNNTYIYAYALDGYIHKHTISNGVEVVGGGWPVQATKLPNNIEKGSASLNIGNGYLYMTLSGNDGDYGHYVGHVVAVNLNSGAVSVWNALCANITTLLDTNSAGGSYCTNVMAGIWARPGVKIDPVTGNVFVATGNGNYDANVGGNNWGDSIIELTPNLSSVVDSYTPASYNNLDFTDSDLGSTAPVILPTQNGSNTPYLLVQSGKDHIVRLLNRTNLSGQGGPRHTGGELQTITISNEVHEQPAVWTDAGGTTWVYVTDESNDLYGYRVVTTGGTTTLVQAFQVGGAAVSSPFVANGVLYVTGSTIQAYNATTGALLFSGTSQGIVANNHWESPIVVNGTLFTTSGQTTLYALNIPGAVSTPVIGDCDNDGHVSVIDLSLLLSHYGQTTGVCDFNNDGIVNVFDLSLLLSHYGT